MSNDQSDKIILDNLEDDIARQKYIQLKKNLLDASECVMTPKMPLQISALVYVLCKPNGKMSVFSTNNRDTRAVMARMYKWMDILRMKEKILKMTDTTIQIRGDKEGDIREISFTK